MKFLGDKFLLGNEVKPGVNIIEWWREDQNRRTHVFETCKIAANTYKPSTLYAPRACKQHGYLGGWEEVIDIEETGYNGTDTTVVTCGQGM